jgi:hypothetical protein
MTVQELINELEKVKNKNLQIVTKTNDPKFTSYSDAKGIGEENVFYRGIDDDYYRRRLVIDGRIF